MTKILARSLSYWSGKDFVSIRECFVIQIPTHVVISDTSKKDKGKSKDWHEQNADDVLVGSFVFVIPFRSCSNLTSLMLLFQVFQGKTKARVLKDDPSKTHIVYFVISFVLFMYQLEVTYVFFLSYMD